MKHAPLRRLLSWRPYERRGTRTSDTGDSQAPGRSFRRHGPAELGRAAATDREAIEQKLGEGPNR